MAAAAPSEDTSAIDAAHRSWSIAGLLLNTHTLAKFGSPTATIPPKVIMNCAELLRILPRTPPRSLKLQFMQLLTNSSQQQNLQNFAKIKKNIELYGKANPFFNVAVVEGPQNLKEEEIHILMDTDVEVDDVDKAPTDDPPIGNPQTNDSPKDN